MDQSATLTATNGPPVLKSSESYVGRRLRQSKPVFWITAKRSELTVKTVKSLDWRTAEVDAREHRAEAGIAVQIVEARVHHDVGHRRRVHVDGTVQGLE